MLLRLVYTVLLYLLIPFILLRLYWKGRRMPSYRKRLSERFSLGKIVSSEVDIWLHAVSLGEVVAATPLIDALLAADYTLLVTTMTPTGSQQVLKRFGNHVSHQYIPYDFPWALRRFFKKINARVGIIMETELWPNLIYQASTSNVPLLLVNARISDKAFEQYKKAKFFFKPILTKFCAVLTQSEQDAMRFLAIGAPRVRTLGNMKFDLQINIPNREHVTQLKIGWGETRPVFIAASTHDDEEHQILSGLNRLKKIIPDIVLLIAPRHPERFKTVYELSKEQGFNTGLRSQFTSIDNHTDVVVLDSLGELLGFYEISDYAFVGGSLIPIGGHNVLEPIAVQVPTFCGPYMQNSKAICADLCAAGALQMVNDVECLFTAIIAMHQKPKQRTEQIMRATVVLEANRGAVKRYFDEVGWALAQQ